MVPVQEETAGPLRIGLNMIAVARLLKNTRGRDLVVGNIHGLHSQLVGLLEAVGFDPQADRLICCGNLTADGPEWAKVVGLLEEKWFFSVMGDIDLWLCHQEDSEMRAVLGEAKWLTPGPTPVWAGLPESERRALAHRLKALPIALEIETDIGLVGVVNGEVPLYEESSDFVPQMGAPPPSVDSFCVKGVAPNPDTTIHAPYRRLHWEEFKDLLHLSDPYTISSAVRSDRFLRWREGDLVDGVEAVFHGRDHDLALCPLKRGNRHYLDTAAYWVEGLRRWGVTDEKEKKEALAQAGLSILDLARPDAPLVIAGQCTSAIHG